MSNSSEKLSEINSELQERKSNCEIKSHVTFLFLIPRWKQASVDKCHSHTDRLSQAVQVRAVAVDAVVHMRGQAGVRGSAVAPVTERVNWLNRSDIFILFSPFVLFASRALVILLVSFTVLGY